EVARSEKLTLPQFRLSRSVKWELEISGDRNLAAARGRLHHVLRDEIAGKGSAQRGPELFAFGDARAEMLGARDPVAVVEGIRQHAFVAELAEELTQSFGVVVHAFEEHALVEHGDAAPEQERERAPGLVAELARMIEMRDDEEAKAAGPLDRLDQLRRNAG